MAGNEPIRCRVAACPDGPRWTFYLINDSAIPLDLAVLDQVCYEWGDFGSDEAADVRVTALAPGDHAVIWRDDGDGAELRMDLVLRVHAAGREVRLRFEFPKLYLLRELPLVDGLGQRGWPVAAGSGDG